MRTIVSIVVCCMFVLSAVAACMFYNAAGVIEQKNEQYKSELSVHRRAIAKYKREQNEISRYEDLWKEIRENGLDPAKWVQYPVNLNATLSWKELKKLIILAGNTTEGNIQWFMPERLRVTRKLVRVKSNSSGEVLEVPQAGDLDQEDLMQVYELSIDGRFLVQK